MNEPQMTVDQKACGEETGHDWLHHSYEYDTNYGGFKECRLCGWTESDNDGGGDDFE